MDVGERAQWRLRFAAHGYEPTREPAMAAFAKSWRRTVARAANGESRGAFCRFPDASRL
jgi:hypothetical protein